MHVYAHVPALQDDDAFGREPHDSPHIPQFDVSLAVLVSHPSAALPLQLSHGLVHMYPQVPPMQLRVAFAGDGQTFMHAPQFERFVAVLISHPSPAVALQSSYPMLQEKPHAPIEHVRLAFGRVAHTVPQAPQLSRLERVSTSHPFAADPSQSANPALHV